jgi:hypothetical protein
MNPLLVIFTCHGNAETQSTAVRLAAARDPVEPL